MLYRRYHAAQKARREAEIASWNADAAQVAGAVATPEQVAKPAPTPAAQPQQQNKQQQPNQRR